MGYVAPPHDAADFNFTGLTYAPPSASAADLTFGLGGGATEAYVIAQSPLGRPYVVASGDSRYVMEPNLSAVTVFGAGAAAFLVNTAVSVGANTVFGTASSPHPQQSHASGFKSGGFGTPYVSLYTPPLINWVCSASGWLSVQFGEASAAGGVTVAGTGLALTEFGFPTVRLWQPTYGQPPSTAFGAASVSLRTRCSGFMGTHFGHAVSSRTQAAASTFRPTRWGVAHSLRSNTYLAAPVNLLVRFGLPVASRLNAYQATSIAAEARIGTPTCMYVYRARHTAPTTRFGKPILRRAGQC